jgi:hypothetical protein
LAHTPSAREIESSIPNSVSTFIRKIKTRQGRRRLTGTFPFQGTKQVHCPLYKNMRTFSEYVLWQEEKAQEQEVEVDLGRFGTILATLRTTTITYMTGKRGSYYEYEAEVAGKTITAGNWHPQSALQNFQSAAAWWLAHQNGEDPDVPTASVSPITGLRWTGD